MIPGLDTVPITFSSLEVGEHFSFPTDPTKTVHTKHRGLWYADPTGRRWMTGHRTAVIRVAPEDRP